MVTRSASAGRSSSTSLAHASGYHTYLLQRQIADRHFVQVHLPIDTRVFGADPMAVALYELKVLQMMQGGIESQKGKRKSK
jgi:hypothetical protein